jgi:hypothetical protein
VLIRAHERHRKEPARRCVQSQIAQALQRARKKSERVVCGPAGPVPRGRRLRTVSSIPLRHRHF